MDKLKSAIADKVLEISASDSLDIKPKLDKINRFRDFVDACQSLINKYPDIESEFLRMIENDDFNTRVAASRVDSIIRLSESENRQYQKNDIQEDITELEEIADHLPTYKNSNAKEVQSVSLEGAQVKEENPILKSLPIEDTDAEKENQYIDFEEVIEDNSQAESASQTQTVEEPDFKEKDGTKKDILKKVIQVCGIIAVLVALIFTIKFIIKNWELILWILGGCAAVFVIVWYFLKKRKEEKEN